MNELDVSLSAFDAQYAAGIEAHERALSCTATGGPRRKQLRSMALQIIAHSGQLLAEIVFRFPMLPRSEASELRA
jgi:hypothetical protein